jgi:hypothetical protein
VVKGSETWASNILESQRNIENITRQNVTRPAPPPGQ